MDASQKIFPSNSRGFTLIEVLMAMLIMTVGLLGLLQSVNVAYEHNSRNRIREEAVLVAEEQMNVMRVNHARLEPYTTVTRTVGGVKKRFTVNRDYRNIGDSSRLLVAVRWSFKNVTTIHEIYTIKKM